MDARVTSWSSLLETGIAEIDAQHRQLFELAASFSGQGDEIRVMKSLAILCDYVKTHLRDEEAMLTAIGYTDLAAHRIEHDGFRRALRELLREARGLTLDDIAERVDRLINGWFLHHITHVDARYVPAVTAYTAGQERLRAQRQRPGQD